MSVCMCAGMCAHARACDYRKFTECKTEIYKAKPAESIISLHYHTNVSNDNLWTQCCAAHVLSEG